MSNLKFGVILLVLLILLGTRFLFFYKDQPKLRSGEEIFLETTLLSEPKTTIRSQIFSVSYKNQRITVFAPLYPEIHYADSVKIIGNLNSRLTNGKENFSLNAKIEAERGKNNYILAISSSVRQKLISFYQENLSPNYSGLMLGIVFGIKEYMPSSFLNDLKTAGVMHIIAASGMNVTLVAGFLNSIFLIFFKRQVALSMSIIGIIIYAVLAGMEPSIIRASIMGCLVFLAAIFGRQMWASYSLVATGFIMLFYDPSLLYDIGFQLSFLATTGLLYLSSTPVKQASSASTEASAPFFKNKFLDGFQTTIFAQVTTLPILIANFGTYSIWSIVVNSLVLWTVPVLMVIGGVSAIISLIIEPVARIFLYLSLPILIFFESVIEFFSHPGGLINIASVNWAMILGYYFLVIALILFRKLKKQADKDTL